MGFAFYPDDSAKLRDAFQKQFPQHNIVLTPERAVGDHLIRVELYQPYSGPAPYIACNTFEAAMHLDSCVISGELYIPIAFQNLGIGQRMMQAKIEWANRQRYTLLATIRDHNEVQKHILTKFNWRHVGADLWAYTPIKE